MNTNSSPSFLRKIKTEGSGGLHFYKSDNIKTAYTERPMSDPQIKDMWESLTHLVLYTFPQKGELVGNSRNLGKTWISMPYAYGSSIVRTEFGGSWKFHLQRILILTIQEIYHGSRTAVSTARVTFGSCVCLSSLYAFWPSKIWHPSPREVRDIRERRH